MLKKIATIALGGSIYFATVTFCGAVLTPMVAMAKSTTAAVREKQCVHKVDGKHLQGTALQNAIATCKKVGAASSPQAATTKPQATQQATPPAIQPASQPATQQSLQTPPGCYTGPPVIGRAGLDLEKQQWKRQALNKPCPR